MSNWKIVSHGGTCDHCGGKEGVVKYRDESTGETQRVCDPCESAAAAVRGAER